jgi:hypothetical protein
MNTKQIKGFTKLTKESKMSREIRRVSSDWEHPRYPSNDRFEGGYIPLHNGEGYKRDLKDWEKNKTYYDMGLRPSYGAGADEEKEELVALTAEDISDGFEKFYGEKPLQERYMPLWTEEQKTLIMMYESTSEGTPISPAFKTSEELARWLADNNASAFGGITATYEQWLSTCKEGWAISAVFFPGKGIVSGVEAQAKEKLNE